MSGESQGYTYPYPRPAVTVDAAVLRPAAAGIEILLIQRGHEPFAGRFALPGGFLDMDEEPVAGAARELGEETGISGLDLAPLMAAGKVGRDPRARCITLIFGALVKGDDLHPRGGDDASHAGWYPLTAPPAMAFDHADLIHEIAEHLRWQAATAIVGRRLWPEGFEPGALVALHRSILGQAADDPIERGMRLGLLEPVPPGQRYRFRPRPAPLPDWHPLVW
ncbi:MAG: putative Nudix-like regulator [Candidatus Ozemobacter sibiricus]|jgi:8-oxo-dGTP diphosphatase|uniref:Putative Nudix-like regulator n=1 Tax=Candidatus Ozemobacter sibiricus TaxID=2268124 RepID=A0A367ZWL4_9BACT|nr:MAG: putative Nudix-like regulator [Candidatus Ozemobacter sibiricus]